jgi:hypothetical protein
MSLPALVEWMSGDPELRETIEAVGGLRRLDGAVRYTQAIDPNRQGAFRFSEPFYRRSLPAPGERAPWRREIREAADEAYSTRTRSLPTQLILDIARPPTIDLRSGLTHFETYAVFAHELTHLRAYKPFQAMDEDILDYAGPGDYVARTLLAPGGEFDAFVAQGRAVARLRTRDVSTVMTPQYPIERFFAADGLLVDREGLVRFVLEDLGYRASLEKEYHDKVIAAYDLASRELEWHEGPLRAELADRKARALRNETRGTMTFLVRYEERVAEAIRRLNARLKRLEAIR